MVGITNHSFVPAEVTIPRGATVTWVALRGRVAHTTTADDRAWDSGLINRGQTFSRTFPASGTNPYFCIPHPVAMRVG